MSSIKKISVCKPEEEVDLCLQAQEGNLAARNRLIEGNLRLVAYIASKLQRRTEHIDIQDLISEGVKGLFKAIEKFDSNSRASFATYSTWWIKNHIYRYIANFKNTVRIPVNAQKDLDIINSFKDAYFSQHGVYPSSLEIIQETNLTEDIINIYSNALCKKITFQNSYYKIKHKEFPLYHFYTETNIENNTPIDMVDECEVFTIDDIIKEGGLTEIEEKIIIKRFGLFDSLELTLDVVSKDIHRTRERVRQIEKRALLKILHNLIKKYSTFFNNTKDHFFLSAYLDLEENKLQQFALQHNEFLPSFKMNCNKIKELLIGYLKQDLLQSTYFDLRIQNELEIKENITSQEQLFDSVVGFLEEVPYMSRVEIAEELNLKYPKIHVDSSSLGWLLSYSTIKVKRKWGHPPVYYLDSWVNPLVEKKTKKEFEIDLLHDLYTQQSLAPRKKKQKKEVKANKKSMKKEDDITDALMDMFSI